MNSSSGDSTEQPNCALCLVALPPKSESKVCKKCFDKHSSHNNKYATYPFSKETTDQLNKDTAASFKANVESLPEHFCNLCKQSFATATELEEHLIEHSFRGCEERGYNCYICSSIFTLPSGLRQHMMIDHGPNYRPYDCNLCANKFYFRAELDNHRIDHETGRFEASVDDHTSNEPNGFKQLQLKHEHNQTKDANDGFDSDKDKEPETHIKSETQQYAHERNVDDDDDEYIEVEQIGENTSVDGETNNENSPQSPRPESDA